MPDRQAQRMLADESTNGDAWLRTMTTVQQLADYLDVPEKTLRRWLRRAYPAKAPGRGSRWRLTPEMNRRMAGRALGTNGSPRPTDA